MIGAIESTLEAVEVLLVGDRQRVGDHHLAHRGVLQPVDGRARQHAVGGQRPRPPLPPRSTSRLAADGDGAGGVDHVVDEHAAVPSTVADDLGRLGDVVGALRPALVDERELRLDAGVLEAVGEAAGELAATGVGRRRP